MGLTLAGLLVVLSIGAAVVWSVVGDARMLTGAFGIAGLALFLVVPALVLLFGRNDRPDR